MSSLLNVVSLSYRPCWRDADSDRDEFVQSDDVDGFMEYAYKNL